MLRRIYQSIWSEMELRKSKKCENLFKNWPTLAKEKYAIQIQQFLIIFLSKN